MRTLKVLVLVVVAVIAVSLQRSTLAGSAVVSPSAYGASCVPGPGADLSGCDFAGTNLSGVSLSGANITLADFSGADLAGANLSNAVVITAMPCSPSEVGGTNPITVLCTDPDPNFSGANLTGVDLSGVNLAGGTVSDGQFCEKGVCFPVVEAFEPADLNGVTSGSILGTPILPSGWNLIDGVLASDIEFSTSGNSSFVEGVPGSVTIEAISSNTVFEAVATPLPSLFEQGLLPAHVTFVDNGDGTATLSGTAPSGTAATYPITITASNGVSPDASQSFSLSVVPIATTSLPNGSVWYKTNRVKYSGTLSAVGGNPPYHWSLAPGSGPLPPSLRLNQSTGVISGRATVASLYRFTVQVKDTKTKRSKGHPATQNTATAQLSIAISP